MKNLPSAFYAQYNEKMPPGFDDVLMAACRRPTIAFEEIQKIEPRDIEEMLLFAWDWKLLIPMASSQCSEWDNRLMVMKPGQVYEIPNISRTLIKSAVATGRWDIRGSVSSLYSDMGETRWQKMPDLVDAITSQAVNYTIGAAAINAACIKAGIKNKTGAMIAILKGGGIISPKLAALGPVAKTGAPVYEVNPSVYPGPQRPDWKLR